MCIQHFLEGNQKALFAGHFLSGKEGTYHLKDFLPVFKNLCISLLRYPISEESYFYHSFSYNRLYIFRMAH